MYKNLSLIAVLCSLIFFSACKGTQGLGGNKLKNRSADYVKKQLIQNQLDAQWFSGKAKIKFRDADRGITAFSSIRLRKDSIIWMNVKAFGIEAGRVLIRPDSIFVLDRLNKGYMAKEIWWLQDEFGLPVNFSGLQAMLLGNPVFFHSEFEVSKDSLNYILQGENEKYKAIYKAEGLTFKLTEMLISQIQDKRTGLIELSDYQKLETGEEVSFNRNIEMQSPETGAATVQIIFSKVTVNEPVGMPFSIPPRYTKQ